MEQTTRLYLVRHAEVDEAYHETFGGVIDMGISNKGHEQANALAGFFKKVPLDAVHASPMKRVQLTLNPTLKALEDSIPTNVDHNLREVDFGEWTGHRWDEVKEKFGVPASDWLDHLQRGTVKEAEQFNAWEDRISTSIDSILEHGPGKRVAVFCHGGVVRMALSILLKMPLQGFAAFECEYASVTVVDCIGPDRRLVQLLNHTPWRPHL